MIYQIFAYSETIKEKKKNLLPYVIIYSSNENEIRKCLKIFIRIDKGFKPVTDLLPLKPDLKAFSIEPEKVIWYPCNNEDSTQWYKE